MTQAKKHTKASPTVQRRDPVAERNFDEHLLGVAEQATQEAHDAALEAGLSVETIDGGAVYRQDPDGTRTEVRKVKPPVPVNTTKKHRLR
ncbi:MAG: hypothetical protein AAF809_14255 [Bacteroidota bacterium]